MIFNKTKIGFFKEKYRLQLYSLNSLIFWNVLLAAAGVLCFWEQPLGILIQIFFILVFDILMILYSRMLLIYDDGFVVSTIAKFSGSLEHIPFENMKRIYIHIGSGRGSHDFTFYYNHLNEKKRVIFFNIDVDKPVEALRFLFKKGVCIYVNSEKYGEAIFGVERILFDVVKIKYKTWFTFQSGGKAKKPEYLDIW